MLLRTRLTWMVLLGLVLMVAVLGGAGLLREQLLAQRLARALQAAQAHAWGQALDAQQDALRRLSDELVQQPGFLQAAQDRDAQALHEVLTSADAVPAPGAAVQLLALWSGSRNPLTLGQDVSRPVLGRENLERALSGQAVGGLRTVGDGRALVFVAQRLLIAERAIVLVLARDTGALLHSLREKTAAHASLLDLRGRLLASTEPDLWQAAAGQVALRVAQQRDLAVQGLHYSAVSLPVRDASNNAIGTVVTLTEHGAEAQAGRFLGWLALGSAAALLLAIGLGLNLYLRRRLRPLEQAIGALQALAQGDTQVSVPQHSDDEIGRIASAIEHFRATVQELLAARALRERVRRRQEGLLRTRLQELAQATHQSLALSPSQSEQDQLRQLARVMNELGARLIDQHRRLSGMVQELREALIGKERLAGLEQELQIAAQVQLSILPRHPPQDARLALHSHITPAREVGGDFYDYFLVSPDHLGFVIADVSGKGVPAALFMTIARTLLKATAQFILEPTPCIEQLNRLLAAENEQMMFVTLFYGVLDLRRGTVDYVNAGHNPPYVLRCGGRPQLLPRTGGMAVAVLEDAPYASARLKLEPGMMLFLYTDGVTEAMDATRQEYGDARLLDVLGGFAAPGRTSPQALTQAVVASVHAFEDGAPQADDITCLALRWEGSA
ncbi:MAG: SpoIIE family protein phosphatase [Ottowia sp.]|nr:SpoIIE family protein phosphatase [Ottowia sp.]